MLRVVWTILKLNLASTLVKACVYVGARGFHVANKLVVRTLRTCGKEAVATNRFWSQPLWASKWMPRLKGRGHTTQPNTTYGIHQHAYSTVQMWLLRRVTVCCLQSISCSFVRRRDDYSYRRLPSICKMMAEPVVSLVNQRLWVPLWLLNMTLLPRSTWRLVDVCPPRQG